MVTEVNRPGRWQERGTSDGGGSAKEKSRSEADGIYYGEHEADETSVAHVGLCSPQGDVHA